MHTAQGRRIQTQVRNILRPRQKWRTTIGPLMDTERIRPAFMQFSSLNGLLNNVGPGVSHLCVRIRSQSVVLRFKSRGSTWPKMNAMRISRCYPWQRGIVNSGIFMFLKPLYSYSIWFWCPIWYDLPQSDV